MHRDFQQKTMRGGGSIYHADPMFLEMYFAFCSLLNFSTLKGPLDQQLALCHEQLFGEPINDELTFLTSLEPEDEVIVPIGKTRELSKLFLGMYIVDRLTSF